MLLSVRDQIFIFPNGDSPRIGEITVDQDERDGYIITYSRDDRTRYEWVVNTTIWNKEKRATICFSEYPPRVSSQ